MVGPGTTPYRKLCSSFNKINSLGKPSNRWKDIYVNKAILGDGDADSDVRLVADVTGTDINPELKYNVTDQKWQVSHDGVGFGNIQSIYVSTESPDNSIGANGDLWVVYSDFVCGSPSTWFKFTMDQTNNGYIRNIMLTTERVDIDGNPYYDANSVATLNDGIAYSSSYEDDGWSEYIADGVFDLESGAPWHPDSNDPAPWIAFKFNTPTAFSYLYLETAFGDIGEEGWVPMSGGSVYVSNNSTNGVDGTWQLLRSGILNQPDIDNEVFVGVSLCTEDPVDVFYPAH